MGHATSVLSAGMLILAGCAPRLDEPPPQDPAAERAAVEAAVTYWFDSAVARLDTAAIARGVTPTFAILEDSVWYDREGFVAFVASLPSLLGGPFAIRYSLGDWRTAVRGDVAWTSFRNRAVVTPSTGEPFPLDWRETAVLVNVDGRWLIDRYQSAPVASPPAAPR